jgi:hypothetical protein
MNVVFGSAGENIIVAQVRNYFLFAKASLDDVDALGAVVEGLVNVSADFQSTFAALESSPL